MIYFSFSLYGTHRKYTHGMIANVDLIARRFPEARVAIHIAEDVPAEIRERLTASPNVLLIPVNAKAGSEGMLDRFLTIDLSDCDIMFVRDADSRVHERDAACIEDFIQRPECLFHIIRDHYYHTHAVLGGMWGIRKAALTEPMTESVSRWKAANNREAYMADQYFLEHVFYNRLAPVTLVHDRTTTREPAERKLPFRVPIVDHLFVGQVHDYNEDGAEKVVFCA
jgi:hypothetical protein